MTNLNLFDLKLTRMQLELISNFRAKFVKSCFSVHLFTLLIYLLWPSCSIPTTTNGDSAIYSTEIYQKEQTGNIQKLVFTKLDVAELDSLFIPGSVLDAFFCPELYDYQQNAGIRLVAKRLVVHSKWH